MASAATDAAAGAEEAAATGTDAAAAVEHAAAAADDDSSAPGAPMSKRQQKKLLKRQLREENRQAVKQQRKKQKAEHKEQRRSSVQEMLEGMTEEERTAWRAQQKAKRTASQHERAAARTQVQQALTADLKIVIDLDFEGLMSDGEIKSLCQQLSYSYSACVRSKPQAHLHLLGMGGGVQAQMQHTSRGYTRWAATSSEQTFAQYFKEQAPDLVYLTADSPTVLEQLDPGKIYVIGGIVDRNRHKGICFERAAAAGVATAKLPIGEHFKLHTSSVLTVNQVVDILVKYHACKDWGQALQQVLPGRKVAEDVDGS